MFNGLQMSLSMYPDAVGDLAFFLASADSWTFTDTPIRNSRSAKNLENISLTTDSISSTLNITEKAAVTCNNSEQKPVTSITLYSIKCTQ